MTTKKLPTKGRARAPQSQPATAPDLAGLIAAVLTHPDVPEVVYDSLIDGLQSLDSKVSIYEQPSYVRSVLAEHERYQREERGRQKGRAHD